MAKRSAGILLHRPGPAGPEVLLVHPGGPFWASRDDGAWSIPKGEVDADEEPLAAARRELAEETGFAAPGTAVALTPVRQKSGKLVLAFAVAGDADVTKLVSNFIQLAWPPRSGQWVEVPEVDRAGWFDLPAARRKILTGQLPLLDELATLLAATP